MKKGINYVRCLQRDLAVSLENNQRAKHPIVMQLPQSKASGCTQGSSPEGRREDLQEGRGSISGKKHVQGVLLWYPGSGRAYPPGTPAVGGCVLLVSGQWEGVPSWYPGNGKSCMPSWYPDSGRVCPPGILAVGVAVFTSRWVSISQRMNKDELRGELMPELTRNWRDPRRPLSLEPGPGTSTGAAQTLHAMSLRFDCYTGPRSCDSEGEVGSWNAGIARLSPVKAQREKLWD